MEKLSILNQKSSRSIELSRGAIPQTPLFLRRQMVLYVAPLLLYNEYGYLCLANNNYSFSLL